MLNKEMILKNVALSYVINSYNIDSTVILLEQSRFMKYKNVLTFITLS